MTMQMKAGEQLLAEWAEGKSRITALAGELADPRFTERERDRALDAFMAMRTDGQIRRTLRQALELLVEARAKT